MQEEPGVVDAGVNCKGFFTKGVVVDEVGVSGHSPPVGQLLCET